MTTGLADTTTSQSHPTLDSDPHLSLARVQRAVTQPNRHRNSIHAVNSAAESRGGLNTRLCPSVRIYGYHIYFHTTRPKTFAVQLIALIQKQHHVTHRAPCDPLSSQSGSSLRDGPQGAGEPNRSEERGRSLCAARFGGSATDRRGGFGGLTDGVLTHARFPLCLNPTVMCCICYSGTTLKHCRTPWRFLLFYLEVIFSHHWHFESCFTVSPDILLCITSLLTKKINALNLVWSCFQTH